MEEVRGKHVSPAIDRLAFNCPHCDALARQFWFSVHADPLKSDEKPVLATAETIKTLAAGNVEEAEHDRKLKWAEQMASGRPFLEVRREFRNRDVQNVSISYCFNCNQMCLWVYDQLVWPKCIGGSEPKLHVSPNVRRESEEASQTLEASPRGAAALLRLTIEKLCKELGVSDESLKDDIGFFVREDIDARVQKVLDADADYREQRCAPRPNRPWGRSSNSRNPIWSGQLDLRKDDHGAEAPAGSVHKAPRECSHDNGAAAASQFMIGGCRRRHCSHCALLECRTVETGLSGWVSRTRTMKSVRALCL